MLVLSLSLHFCGQYFVPNKYMDGLAARPSPQIQPNVHDIVQQALSILKAEEPDFDPSIVGPMTSVPLINRLQVPPGAQAAATPFGNIRYDPAALEGQTPQDVADTLLHEYTHVKQMKPRGVIGQILEMVTQPNLPYGQRPDEIEAWQAERARRARMGRTKFDGAPEFSTSNQSTRGNIALYPERKK